MGTVTLALLGALLVVLQTSTTEGPSCSPGFSSDSFLFRVGRRQLHSGMKLGKVEFSDCSDRRRFVFHSEDSRFSVQSDGALTVKRHVSLHDGHRHFSVHSWDSNGNKFTALVRVQHQEHHQGDQNQGHHHGDGHPQGNHEKHHARGQREVDLPPVAQVPVQDVSSRQKREAARNEESFPKDLKRRKRQSAGIDVMFPENDQGPFPKRVTRVRYTKPGVVHFSITGPGADQTPEGLFTMDKTSGIIYVTQPLDREATDHYTLMVHTVAEGSGQTEEHAVIEVIVTDMNDNRPVFTKDTYFGELAESSPLNYNILQVTATDADQEGTTNALIQYKILDQEPKFPTPDMFTINPVNGFIQVNAQGLDREKNTKYTLEIQAADMEGNGLTGETKVILTVTDSNNNAPAYEQTQYTATVAENEKGAMVVKMLVTDKDDAHTLAWNAKFTIVDGNVNGRFSVETGPNKQEGIISTAKGLDFEKSQTHTLLVAVENEVPFAMKLPTATATVVVTVADVNEAPIFEPTVKQVSKREDLDLESEVVQYTAYDPDTARNQKVMRYRIVSDPAGWLNVAKDTGQVTVKSPMDRESVFVKNDIYTALIGAYDNDEVPATGTGTLQIKLEDVNDNAPSVDERDIKVCNKEPAPHLLSVTDKDGPGFSAPFRVELQGTSTANWIARMNDSKIGIVLLLTTDLDPGFYDVQLQVYDAQGENQVSTVKAQVCSCKGPDVMCEGRAPIGPLLPIILKVLGGILLLLMMVLLLLHFTRRKREDQTEPLLQEDDIRDYIHYDNEEGGGEDDQTFNLSVLHLGLDNRPEVFRNDVAPNFLPAPQYCPRLANLDKIGNFMDDNMKAADKDLTAPYDSLLAFNYEGDSSEAGSLSSLNSSSSGDQDFDYLHEWGPRFKKLTDMYGGDEDEDEDDMI
ncbi:B-cadherin-like [Eucyclogobius newberryi]|uniref:B-cadherin-like n=1 Tax=Eucyclogobius newberryi TaxID=166745 RepID=UPI003B58BBC0